MNLSDLKSFLKEIDDDYDDDAEVIIEVEGAYFYLDTISDSEGDIALNAGESY